MLSLRIKSIVKAYNQSDNHRFLDVTIELYNPETEESKEEVVEERKLAFPIGSTIGEIKAELTKYKETYNLDLERSIKQNELDKVEEEVDQTISALEGKDLDEVEDPEEEENGQPNS